MSIPLYDTQRDENGESTPEKSRKSLLLGLLMIAGGPILYFFGINHVLSENYFEGLVILTTGVSVTIWFIILQWKKTISTTLFASRYLIFLLGCLFLYQISLGGQGNCKALWSYVFPLLTFFMLGKKEGMLWISIFYLFTMIFFFFPHFPLMASVYNSEFTLRFLVSLGLVSVMSFILEITRERTQDRILINQKLLKESENRYRNAYKKLNKTQAQLIQSGKLASIGELASGVAHELNQPLMVIRGNAQLMQKSLRKNRLGTEELLGQLKAIEKNTKRMTNIINHLRTFSRKSHSKFTPADVNKIITESLLMVGEQLRICNIEVKKDLMTDLPEIMGDANQLEQVFLNLITNARDAIEARDDGRCTKDERRRMKDDSIKGQDEYRGKIEIITRFRNAECGLRIEDSKENETNNPWPRPGMHKSGDRKMEIEEQYKQEDIQITSRIPIPSRSRDGEGGQQSKGFIEILIRDTGCGIPANKVDKIFDPFFTTKEVGKGTGLGLSISYGIINDHKGEIEVAETGPEGTTFRIRLPI